MHKFTSVICLLSVGLFTSMSVAAAATENDSVATQALETGRALFLDNCAECHQSNGRGLKGIYPSLASSEVVRGSGTDVALQLIIGRGEMPSFAGAMSPQDMADVVNYVRNAWGNTGDSIDAISIERLLD
ncbi:MAG: c-type cytochrome [Pseudohongiellaceae bacterium]